MKILVLGSGGREHALAWKVVTANAAHDVITAPGNPGAAEVGSIQPVDLTDLEGLAQIAKSAQVELTIAGPEAILTAGVADVFRDQGLTLFGPSAAAAQIEGSKYWAKQLMNRHGIATAKAKIFTSPDAACRHVSKLPDGSYVIKADSLAEGKGVFIPRDYSEAECLLTAEGKHSFPTATHPIVIEERLHGVEVSVFAFVDCCQVSNLVAVADYKRAYDEDRGPNTGGMGAYSPPNIWTDELAEQALNEIFLPIAAAMVEQETPYQGILYAGLIVTDTGLKVIEFNCRFGDPECQTIMPLLGSDLVEVCQATAEGELERVQVTWRTCPTVTVVATSHGYPGAYETGKPIRGLDKAITKAHIYQAGITDTEQGLVTAGGRVLAATASADAMQAARQIAYSALDVIDFAGKTYRTDIGIPETREVLSATA